MECTAAWTTPEDPEITNELHAWVDHLVWNKPEPTFISLHCTYVRDMPLGAVARLFLLLTPSSHSPTLIWWNVTYLRDSDSDTRLRGSITHTVPRPCLDSLLGVWWTFHFEKIHWLCCTIIEVYELHQIRCWLCWGQTYSVMWIMLWNVISWLSD